MIHSQRTKSLQKKFWILSCFKLILSLLDMVYNIIYYEHSYSLVFIILNSSFISYSFITGHNLIHAIGLLQTVLLFSFLPSKLSLFESLCREPSDFGWTKINGIVVLETSSWQGIIDGFNAPTNSSSNSETIYNWSSLKRDVHHQTQ